MKLFSYVQSKPALFPSESLVGLLARRLSIEEAISASQYPKPETILPESAIASLIQSKCKQLQYNHQQVVLITKMFTEISTISHFIRVSSALEWQSEGGVNMKKRGIQSAKHILPECKDKDQKQAMIKYITDYTKKIIERLGTPDLMTDLSNLQSALIHCFPGIFQPKLNESFGSMRALINQFKDNLPLPLTDDAKEEEADEDGDMVIIKAADLRFFSAEPVQTLPAAAKASCTLS